MPFTMQQRAARLGANLNVRPQNHGEDLVTACDIPLRSFFITEDEFCKLLLDKSAGEQIYRGLFNINGKLKEPLCNHLTITIDEKFENCTVSLTLGLAKEPIELTDVKLARISLKHKSGGMFAMSCQIQCVPEDKLNRIAKFLKKDVEAKIRIGQLMQPDQDELDLKVEDDGKASSNGRGGKGAESDQPTLM